MKDQTLLCVKLPITDKNYDFWVPDNMCMQEISQFIEVVPVK